MRSALFVVGLAWRRLRRRDSGAAITMLGLAVATAVLAGVLAGVTIATDRSTAQAIERIPPSARSVRAVWFGIPGDPSERLAVLDRDVEDAFSGLGLDGPTPLVLFRESTVAGRFVGITGIDGVGPNVILRSGRLPRTCTPTRCEVLRLRGRGRLPNAPGLRLVEVGTGTLRSTQLYGDFLRSTDAATADAILAPALGQSGSYHRPIPGPLVVAEGRTALEVAPALSRTYRTYSWVWPVDPGRPRLWDIDALVRDTERARAELTARSSSFDVDAPVEELRAAQRAADIAGTRLLLVGGEGAALLLAFTVLAARGMRRDLEQARRRLTWFGARRWQLWLLSGVESAGVAVAGVVVGWLLGIAVAGLAASLAGAPVDDVLRESVLSSRGLALAGAAAVAAAVLVWITVTLPTREGARLQGVDLVAIAALLVAAVALASGAADEDRLARGQGAALLLLLLPGLLAIVAAIGVARVFPAIARWWSERKRSALSARLAAVGLARGPGGAVATVAFLTIAFALALLAEGIGRRSRRGSATRRRSRCRSTSSCARTSRTSSVSSTWLPKSLRPVRRRGRRCVPGAPRGGRRGPRGARERRDRARPRPCCDRACWRVAARVVLGSWHCTSSPISSLPGTRSSSAGFGSPAIALCSVSLRASSRSRRSFAFRTEGSAASRSEQPKLVRPSYCASACPQARCS